MRHSRQAAVSDRRPTGRVALPRLRWIILGLVFLATVINYLDRQTLSVLAPVLQDEFRMTPITYSRIVSAFMLAYTIMNGLSGPVIDRLGAKLGYALTVAWWSTAEILHAFSGGVVSLGIFRFFLGMGEAGNWPGAIKVVAEWFPPGERALASGIFNSGSSIGALLAPPLVTWITLRFGWREAFAFIGLSGFAWLLLWWAIYRSSDSVSSGPNVRPPRLRTLLKDPFLLQLTASKVFSDPVWYFYIFWFPQYLKSARGFTLLEIGRTAWIPFLAADLGNLLGGVVSALLIRRGMPAARAHRLCVVRFSLLMTAAIPAVLTGNPAVSIGFVSLAALGYAGSLANLLSIPADAFPKEQVSSVWGIASMGAGLGGMVFSLITGSIVERWSFTPVFLLFGTIPLLAAWMVWRLPTRSASG